MESRAFGDVPIHVPVADRRWFLRFDVEPALWEGHRELLTGLTLIQCGGHFEGSAVLDWAPGAGGKGESLRPHEFERIYGGWTGDVVDRGGHEAVERSADRDLRSIGARRP